MPCTFTKRSCPRNSLRSIPIPAVCFRPTHYSHTIFSVCFTTGFYCALGIVLPFGGNKAVVSETAKRPQHWQYLMPSDTALLAINSQLSFVKTQKVYLVAPVLLGGDRAPSVCLGFSPVTNAHNRAKADRVIAHCHYPRPKGAGQLKPAF